MMSTLQLALRNLMRNRRRSLATLLTMVVGLTAILLFGGYRSNIVYGSLTGFVQYSGHLQVQRQGYFEEGSDNPVAYGIRDYPRLIARLKADPQLSPLLNEVTPVLQLGGVAGQFAANVSRSVMVTGLEPAARNRMLRWNEYGVVSYAKPLALEGSPLDSAIVGQGVARKLKLCNLLASLPCQPLASGDKNRSGESTPADLALLASKEQNSQPAADGKRIELLAASQQGAPNVTGLQAIKAYNMGIKALDDVYLAMHLATAQRLVYGQQAPQVTAILIQLRHTADLPRAYARIRQLLSGNTQDLTVLDFKQINPIYGQTIQFMDSMFGFIAMLIAVIVLFTLGNAMSSAVMERTTEIGTLRALGLRRSGIRSLFLAEATLLALAGIVLGLAASLSVATLINHSGWSWTPPGYSYAYLILVRVGQDLPLLAGSIGGMLLVSLLSAWWPARRASRLQIVDALRHA